MARSTNRRSFIGIISRLLFWYSVWAFTFRCPSSITQLDDKHPQICRPYLQARSVIEPQVKPYIEPAYTSYVAPYIQAARPYTDKAYSKVYIPASNIATNVYTRHVEPIVIQALAQGQKQWQRQAQPYVDRYSVVVNKQYNQYVGPHIKEANRVLYPWVSWTRSTADKQYHQVLLPTLKRIAPYVQKLYNQGHHYTLHYAVPTAQHGAHTAVVFVQRRIWPSIRILYGQHIEPQISKIRLRLASYTDGKKMEAVVYDNAEYASEVVESKTVEPVSLEDLLIPVPTTATSVLSALSSTLSQTASSISSTLLPTTSTSIASTTQDSSVGTTYRPVSQDPSQEVSYSPVSRTKGATGASVTQSHVASAPAHQPSDDISKWQSKFARAADQGSTDLHSRISDILSRQIDGQVKGVGEALLTQLEVEAEEALSNVKSSIVNAVSGLLEESTNDHKAEALHDIIETLRASAKTVKDRAQQVREWKANYDVETSSMIESATESTMSVLDGIRDLGLQRIGMRWAELDDVTYQDWTSYHQLKRTFDQLRADILTSAKSTDGHAHAKAEATRVLDTAMNIAGDMALELSRLKDVAKWKIEAKDASDDYSTRYATVAAAKELGQKIAGIFGAEENASSDERDETVDDVSSLAKEASSSSSAPLASEVTEVTSSVTEEVSAFSETISTAIEDVLEPTTTGSSTVSITSTVTDPAIDIARSIEEFYSTATESVTSALHETSSVVSGAVRSSRSSVLDDVAVPTPSVEGITETIVPAHEEVPEEVKDDLSSTISPSALHSVSSAASVASELSSSVIGTVMPSASASIVKQSTDIVNGAHWASTSMQSIFNTAGEGLADMTNSLASAAKASASGVAGAVSGKDG